MLCHVTCADITEAPGRNAVKLMPCTDDVGLFSKFTLYVKRKSGPGIWQKQDKTGVPAMHEIMVTEQLDSLHEGTCYGMHLHQYACLAVKGILFRESF